MPNVNPAGPSAPPVSGRVGDPRQANQAETAIYGRTSPGDASDPAEQSVVGANHGPEHLSTGDREGERACGQGRNREEVIKEISIRSTTFIGPTWRPEPAIEDELSEFYKELAQIDQQDAVDVNDERGSDECSAPSHAVDGNTERAQFYAPPFHPSAIKEKTNSHKNAYRPYPNPNPWPHTDYRNSSQWRPETYNVTCSWPNSHSSPDHWQLPPPPPPPSFRFYPPPRPTYPPYCPPQGQRCDSLENSSFRFCPDVRLGPCLSPDSPAMYREFERQHHEKQNYQDVKQLEQHEAASFVMILMRGLPGSGKSTLARHISSSGPSGLVLSTDDYFYQENGYHFDPTLLGAAHDWNQNRAIKAMLDKRTPVIIDNTNVQAWEMKPYVTAALETGYRVEFVEPETSWKCDPVELERRNHHGVQRETIANMLDRFELPISVDIVMNSCEPPHKRREHHSRPYRDRR